MTEVGVDDQSLDAQSQNSGRPAGDEEHSGHGSQTPQSAIQRMDNGPEASQLAGSEQIASGTPKYCY
ncbi:hypothetical protein AAG906_034354 [Vitis piasezkii]